MKARTANLAAGVALVSLVFLCVAWELWLAPLRPGGSWLVLKVIPLLFPLLGIFNGRRYTYKWSSLLVWLYVAEGLVRVVSDPASNMKVLAGVEIALSLAFFGSIVAYLRASRTS